MKIRNQLVDSWKKEMERGDDCEYQGVGEGKRKTWINSKTTQEVISKRFRERFHKAWWKRNATSRATGCCLLKWVNGCAIVLVADGSLECHEYCKMTGFSSAQSSSTWRVLGPSVPD